MGGVLIDEKRIVALLYDNVCVIQFSNQSPRGGFRHRDFLLLRGLHLNACRSILRCCSRDYTMLTEGRNRGAFHCSCGSRCHCRIGLRRILDRRGECLVLLGVHCAEEAFLLGNTGVYRCVRYLCGCRGCGRRRRCLLTELHLRSVGSLIQCTQNAVMHTVKYRFFVQEFDLGLCRVDIHIYSVCRQLQVKYTGRELANHNLVAVGFFQCGDQKPGLYRSSIYKEGL